MELMNKIKKVAVTGLVGIVLACPTLKAETLNLQLNHSFVGSDYTTDTFNARYDTENGDISNSYDVNDIKQIPNITDNNFIQAYTIDTGFCLTEDYRVFDPNETYWDIRLMAEDYELFQGFTGTARIEVDDPNTIIDVNNTYDVYLHRYDKDEQFVESYDLRDPNNYTIDWSVTEALGNYATLELMVGFQTNYADFNADGYVNFVDYSMFAENWLKEDTGLTGDLDEDNDVDYNDLSLFVDEWLWTRREGG